MSKTQIATGGIADDAVTAAKATGFGKIGQVLNVVNNTQKSTTSTSFVDMDMSLAITPSATSSKILVQVHLNGAFINTSSSEGIQTRLQVTPSGGSAATIAVYNGYGLQAEANSGSATLSGSTLHSPSSTSAQTYKIQLRSKNGNAVILGANDSSNATLSDTSTNSMITLMEVLA
jgi:hypothetical protein